MLTLTPSLISGRQEERQRGRWQQDSSTSSRITMKEQELASFESERAARERDRERELERERRALRNQAARKRLNRRRKMKKCLDLARFLLQES